MLSKNPGAGLARFSNVEPRVMTTPSPSRAINSRSKAFRFGVVETQQRGCFPSRNVSCNMSQTSRTFDQEAKGIGLVFFQAATDCRKIIDNDNVGPCNVHRKIFDLLRLPNPAARLAENPPQ